MFDSRCNALCLIHCRNDNAEQREGGLRCLSRVHSETFGKMMRGKCFISTQLYGAGGFVAERRDSLKLEQEEIEHR